MSNTSAAKSLTAVGGVAVGDTKGPSVRNAVHFRWAGEVVRIGNQAVRAAQEESRRLGVPNVYSINGILYYELPSGELSRTDPYVDPGDAGESSPRD